MTTSASDELMTRAVALHKAGRIDEAIALYRDILQRDPRLVQAHGNLGSAYERVGRFEEAARSYERVLRLLPGNPVGHARLGGVLQRIGRYDEALEHLSTAYLEAPGEALGRARLVAALARVTAPRATPTLRRALAALAADDAAPHQHLVPAAAGILKGQPPVLRALRAIRKHGGLRPGDLEPELYRALSEPLVVRILRDCVFSDVEIESLFTAVRAALLEAVVEEVRVVWPDAALASALALQALTTEWVYAETLAEYARLAGLDSDLRTAERRITAGSPSRALQVYALYRPLADLPHDETLDSLARSGTDDWADVLRRHLLDPPRERSLAASLPRLAIVKDDVSRRVQAQYEERPYPRWRGFPRRSARPLGEVLAGTLRRPELAKAIDVPAPRILVAGCGTGRHAIATATRFEGADVFAIDLSLTSLGYAAREAEARGIDNIAFAQADILGLAARDEPFDVVECSGVLHHMADPEAGWGVLRRLLAPGGLMRIGLYSQRGRALVDSIRALIAERGFEATADGIRAARAAIAALPADDPARRLTASPDFHALSGCRDIFFPAHEDRFDLPRVARALARLGLEFLGFEIADERVRSLYRERFPDDTAAGDLANWDRLEAQMPGVFAAMYQFWCRAR